VILRQSVSCVLRGATYADARLLKLYTLGQMRAVTLPAPSPTDFHWFIKVLWAAARNGVPHRPAFDKAESFVFPVGHRPSKAVVAALRSVDIGLLAWAFTHSRLVR
jgi:hypothetical protein